MAEVLSSARKSNSKIKFLTESNMIIAAQQLMQLSDEDSANNITNNKKDTDDDDGDEEVDQRRSEITSAVIEEIFGKEDPVYRPKMRRYRTLDSIYTATKPMNIARYRKKVRTYRDLNGILA